MIAPKINPEMNEQLQRNAYRAFFGAICLANFPNGIDRVPLQWALETSKRVPYHY